MEQKKEALKVSSKVISVIMKIGYSAMTVVMIASAAVLIFLGITGGKTSISTPWGGTMAISDDTSLVSVDFIALCIQLIVMAVFLFAVFFMAYRMFHGISITGDPFIEKNVKVLRWVGILLAAMTIINGIVETIISLLTDASTLGIYTEGPGIVVGIIVFCLSFIIDYGCALKESAAVHTDEKV